MKIYLDYNATCPLSDAARDAYLEASQCGGNASSIHGYGREARGYVDRARKTVARILGASSAKVIFTSGGTEANNLALCGLKRPLYVSAIEHASVLKVREDAIILPVTSQGVLDLDALERAAQAAPEPSLFSLMLVNNETGVIQPVAEAVKILKPLGHLLHTDAIQAVGKIPFSFDELGVDMMTISAHKFGGPLGCGALIVKEPLHLASLIKGGGQEFGMRSGSVAHPLIHAMAVALETCSLSFQQVEPLRDYLESQLEEYAIIHGRKVARAPNTSSIAMPGIESQLQLMSFDLEGVAVSAGSACSSGKVTSSHVLSAMGVSDLVNGQTIRVSLGPKTTQIEIDHFITLWKSVYKTLKQAA